MSNPNHGKGESNGSQRKRKGEKERCNRVKESKPLDKQNSLLQSEPSKELKQREKLTILKLWQGKYGGGSCSTAPDSTELPYQETEAPVFVIPDSPLSPDATPPVFDDNSSHSNGNYIHQLFQDPPPPPPGSHFVNQRSSGENQGQVADGLGVVTNINLVDETTTCTNMSQPQEATVEIPCGTGAASCDFRTGASGWKEVTESRSTKDSEIGLPSKIIMDPLGGQTSDPTGVIAVAISPGLVNTTHMDDNAVTMGDNALGSSGGTTNSATATEQSASTADSRLMSSVLQVPAVPKGVLESTHEAESRTNPIRDRSDIQLESLVEAANEPGCLLIQVQRTPVRTPIPRGKSTGSKANKNSDFPSVPTDCTDSRVIKFAGLANPHATIEVLHKHIYHVSDSHQVVLACYTCSVNMVGGCTRRVKVKLHNYQPENESTEC